MIRKGYHNAQLVDGNADLKSMSIHHKVSIPDKYQ